MTRNVHVVKDKNGNSIVIINDIRFKGKRSIKWKDVKKYLIAFINDFFEIASTKDIVYIGHDLPDEYTSSKYTYSLKGTLAKAKANAAQGIPEMLKIAINKEFKQNHKIKHQKKAKNGWYKYESRFALPIYTETGEIRKYNVFHVSLLIRHANNNKLYLYDILEIKKETGNPLES